LQNVNNALVRLAHFDRAQSMRTPPRINPCTPGNLARVNVSDSGDLALIQQKHLHLLPVRGQQFREMRQRGFFLQRNNAQRANPNKLPGQSHPLHSPQVARIHKCKRNNQLLAPPVDAADSHTPQGLFRVRGGPLPTLSPIPMHDNRMDHAAAKKHAALDERPQRSHNSLDRSELRHSV
jgi:hypothetical protein